jgi:hypothetical protein
LSGSTTQNEENVLADSTTEAMEAWARVWCTPSLRFLFKLFYIKFETNFMNINHE